MDVRAFGSVYGQSATLPYTSGIKVVPDPTGVSPRRFSCCRALFIEAKTTGQGNLTVELADAQNQNIAINNITGDYLLPLSCTAVISGSVNGVIVLY